MKVGLFFGTFNPIHHGHLIIANYMAEFTDLEEVWLIVSPQNPFKEEHELLDEDHRYHLTKLAIQRAERILVSDIEFALPRPSYTHNTLDYLREEYSKHQFTLIMGSDTLKDLPDWKRGGKILNKNSLYIYPRAPYEDIKLMKHENVTSFDVPLLHISATFIRKAIQSKKSVRYFLPDAVYDYILEHQLYQ